MDYKIVKEISLKSISATGKTKHFVGNREVETPSKLQIIQYPNDDGFYLFYLDDGAAILTDTYHNSVEGAMEQAQWEFNVRPEEWS